MVDKLLNELETVIKVPACEMNGDVYLIGANSLTLFSDGPTSALLNYWAAIASTSGAVTQGGNISKALKNDYTLGMTDSDTDDDRDINTPSNSTELAAPKFEAQFTTFRDLGITDAGVYNLARDLGRAPDIAYGIFHRVGYQRDTAFAAGQEVDGYYVWTDNPVPGYADGGNQTVAQNYVPKSRTLPSFILPA